MHLRRAFQIAKVAAVLDYDELRIRQGIGYVARTLQRDEVVFTVHD
jgi:hypothetical protein